MITDTVNLRLTDHEQTNIFEAELLAVPRIDEAIIWRDDSYIVFHVIHDLDSRTVIVCAQIRKEQR